MKRPLFIFVGWIAAFWLCAVAPGRAAGQQPQGSVFAITEEDDSFSNPFGPHQDRHYTQGLKLTYVGDDSQFRSAADSLSGCLPALGINPSATNLGFVFGQNIYTPTDLFLKHPNLKDRPYAGWLYGGVFLQRRGLTPGGIPVLESFEADLGIVGPKSLADVAQKTFHRWCSFNVPQGWDQQLDTEPGLLLKYARLWRITASPESARFCDAIPYVGASVGNILVAGNVGTTLRVGWDLPADFGVPINDSPYSVNAGLTTNAPEFSAYGFGRVEGRVVGHNIFLDGNDYGHGPQVNKEPLVADLSWGMAVRFIRHVEFSYTHVTRTHEFVGQRHYDVFGSLTLKAMFSF